MSAAPMPITTERFRLVCHENPHVMRDMEQTFISRNTRRSYVSLLRNFFQWMVASNYPAVNETAVRAYMAAQAQAGLAANTRRCFLAAAKKFAYHALALGAMRPETEARIREIQLRNLPGPKRQGKWLQFEEFLKLIHSPGQKDLRGLRDTVVLGLMAGCGLRRSEVCAVRAEQLGTIEGRMCIVQLIGKGGKYRMVPVPEFLRVSLEAWKERTGITEGPLVRRFTSAFKITPYPISDRTVQNICLHYAQKAGIPAVAPHDLRRTFAGLCREKGATLEQLRDALGHRSIAVTERYLGSIRSYRHAACDVLQPDSPQEER